MVKVSVLEEIRKRDWRIANLARRAEVSYPTALAATREGWPTDRVTWGTIKSIAKALEISPIDLVLENNKEKTNPETEVTQ